MEVAPVQLAIRAGGSDKAMNYEVVGDGPLAFRAGGRWTAGLLLRASNSP